MISLRHYQEKGIDMLRQSVGTRHRAPLLVASTGSGKTRLAAAICQMAMAKGKRTLFLTPRRGLTFQTSEAFEALGIENGIIMSGVEHDNRHMVEVGSMDTIIARLSQDKLTGALLGVEAADTIIVDEAHLSVSEKRAEFLDGVKAGKFGDNKLIIGMTATPSLSGGGGLGRIYDDLLVPITMQQLIDEGYLCQPRYFAAEKPDLSGVGMVGGEYKTNELGSAYSAEPIMGDVIENWIRIAENTTTVVFTPTRATAADLVERFCAAGYAAEYVDANTKDKDRSAMYERLSCGTTKIIVNVGIISIGTDIPEIQTVQLATATKSIAKFMQAVGRAMRPADGKEFAYIIDHGGMSLDPKIGPVEDITEWSLAVKSTIQDRNLAAKEERKAPKEIECAKCHTIFAARHACPACGHVMKQQTEQLDFHDADLEEITSKSQRKANKDMTWDEKVYFYGELKSYCAKTGKKIGFAAHSYRARTGKWPNDSRLKQAVEMPVSEDTRKWLLSRQIAYAKRPHA